ncbi:MAG: hypothetical protein IMF11_00205 [Proteobacteria bacterium]|nr:hypothetical protein [Pseudomonadota bacterium]
MFQLSAHLQVYINKVMRETERPVLIQETQDLGLPGMLARTRPHPSHIIVEILPNIPWAQLEQLIAHEITHGYLWYKMGYCQPIMQQEIDDIDRLGVSILVNMVEDIVVNKIVQGEGFRPFAFNYLDMVQRETKAARKGQNIYRDYTEPKIKEKFMVYRYIMAWGFLEYYDIPPKEREIITRFTKAFRYSYPRQYKKAKQVEDIIKENDIFTTTAYCEAIKKVLELWDLDKLVVLSFN